MYLQNTVMIIFAFENNPVYEFHYSFDQQSFVWYTKRKATALHNINQH